LLSKFWVIPAHLKNPLERMAERASGYYRMDVNSPVVGELMECFHSLLGERLDGVLMPWDGKHCRETNWPNRDSGWMIDVFTKMIPDFDYTRFYEWIASIYKYGDTSLLLQAPLCTAAPASPVEVKIPCTVGEEICYPAKVDTPFASPRLDENRLPTPPLVSPRGGWGESAEIAAADAAVPILTAKGVRVRSPAPAKRAVNSAEKKNDPRLWKPRNIRAEESKLDYEEYLKGWNKLRNKVAKRLGVSLT
jgi:hypothetical protein